jgi:hypothetical protein
MRYYIDMGGEYMKLNDYFRVGNIYLSTGNNLREWGVSIIFDCLYVDRSYDKIAAPGQVHKLCPIIV